ncbi:hypothetical protein TNCV_1677121 [Trichonephila clavipes]|nr:hypothetical protein TNCV_1677121 [Trichonephila clavipes]
MKIVTPEDLDQDNGTKLLNYCIISSRRRLIFTNPICGSILNRKAMPVKFQAGRFDSTGDELVNESLFSYTAGQLLRTDNTIIHSNHKMK